MAKIIFILSIFNLLILVSAIIPLWNFEASTIDLLSQSNSYSYEICSKNAGSKNIRITKTITKSNNIITEENTLYIGETSFQTNWEDIESGYEYGSNIYICPKGKNHMNLYNNNGFTELIPNGFSYDEDWELICYLQPNFNYIFIGYLNKYNLFYTYQYASCYWVSNAISIHRGLFDFKWTTEATDDLHRDFHMKAIVFDGSNIRLKGTIFTLEGSNINANYPCDLNLIDSFNYSNAYFDSENDYFYFITFNKDSGDFKSGYFTGKTSFDYKEVASLSINTNSTSPLEFYYNFKVESMTFNRNTRYVLYKIYNTIKEKNYYGIIDVVLNKVIFNTDEVINSFKPYSSNSFLAITANSAYKICALAENNECISSCSSGNIYIDSQRPNFCGTECSKYLMVPTGICVEECDENFFHINGKFCGFCKDVNSTHPYKLLNESGCYDTIPEGTYLYNSKYNLLKVVVETPTTVPENDLCDKSENLYPVNYGNSITKIICYNKNDQIPRLYFDSINEEFKPCFETCLTCSVAGNKSYHNCITCESGYRLKPEGSPKNNCVADCPYYYYTSYNQYKCKDNLPCPKEARLLVANKNKCISDCKNDDTYKYQYNGECFIDCPKGTTKNNYICEDENSDSYTLTKTELDLNYTIFINEIDNLILNYATEFSYTNYHVAEYKSKEFDAIIYKDKDSITKLSLDFPSFNFGTCYEKVQGQNNITEDLIVVVINEKDDDSNPSTSYSFFDPYTGEKLDTSKCSEDTIIVKENILALLDKNSSNYEDIIKLIEQSINIFDTKSDFYTDICFDYDLDSDKDIALKDRLSLFYPNISLCDSGCNQTSVDLVNMTAKCECEFNDFSKSEDNVKDEKEENVLLENLLGDVLDFIDSSNIAVATCATKGLKSIIKCYGFYIILVLLIIDIVFSVLFYTLDLNKIRVYIYNNTQNYLALLGVSVRIINPPLRMNTEKKSNTRISKKEEEEKERYNSKISKHGKKKKIKFQKNIIDNSHTNKKGIRNQTVVGDINNKETKTKINSKDKMLNSSLKLNYHNNKKIIRTSFDIKDKNNDLKYIQNKKYFEEYFETSVEEMEYDDAIRKDKRKFCKSFSDKLINEQIICNTFISHDPLKPRTIKIILFVLNFLLYFIINALFINDDYVSEVYNLKKDDFFSFIPRSVDRIFYATLINVLIDYIVDFFFVQERKMKRIFLREKDNKVVLEEQIISFVKTIKISYISFTIFVFIIFIICLYYIICFNSIYPKMQVEWIKSSIFIFIIIQALSVLQCLFEISLRFMSFYFESERLYKASKIFN